MTLTALEIIVIIIFVIIIVVVWAYGVIQKQKLDAYYSEKLKKAYQDYYDLEAKYKELENKLNELIELIKKEPRRWIGQEIIDFIDLDIHDQNQTVKRKADLRAFVLSGKTTKVWCSGLTRFSREPDSFVVNSSQGGGFKDTWVLSQ